MTDRKPPRKAVGQAATCPVCGAGFVRASRNQVYCAPACRTAAMHQRADEQRKSLAAQDRAARAARDKALQDKLRRGARLTLDEAALAATQAGMSYGQWMLRQYWAQPRQKPGGPKGEGGAR